LSNFKQTIRNHIRDIPGLATLPTVASELMHLFKREDISVNKAQQLLQEVRVLYDDTMDDD